MKLEYHLLLTFKNSKTLALFSLLKLTRITRLTNIINRLNVKEDTKALIKVCQLVFSLFLFVHCLACFWYFIADQEEVWVPPLDFLTTKTTLYTNPIEFKYYISMYTAVLMLGGNEIGPRTAIEIIFICIGLVLCAIINANIFGEMAVLVQMASRKTAQFQEHIDTANTAMKNMRLPNDFQN